MKKVLYIAAGGGGDALSTIAIASQNETENYFASFSWDRKMYDPDIGPRQISDFYNIEQVGKFNAIVSGNSYLKKKNSISFLPLIAKEFHKDFFLLELNRGVKGLHRQIEELVNIYMIDEIRIVDIGGDILASGIEKNLKSPIADAGVLAACYNQKAEVKVMVAGCGLDGELTEEELRAILNVMNIKRKYDFFDCNIERYLKVFQWLPSEASALFLLSNTGIVGRCEIRQDGLIVELGEFSRSIYIIDFDETFQHSEVAKNILMTNSLDEIEKKIIGITGKTELDIERNKIQKLLKWDDNRTLEELFMELTNISICKSEEGIDFITKRRICELLNIRGKLKDEFLEYLKQNHSDKYTIPLWKC